MSPLINLNLMVAFINILDKECN